MDTTEISVPRIFTRNDPTVLRVFPPLAKEIGLNESVILLQLDFLISISRNKEKQLQILDGKAWTRQSLRGLRDHWLPFWSPQTIARALKKLEEDHELIFITDKYNEHKYDKSQWFALNPQGYGRLTTIALHMVQLNGTGVFHIGTGLSQYGTTIPEIPLDPIIGSSIREKDDYIELLNAAIRVCKKIDPLTLTERDYECVDTLYDIGMTPETLVQHYAGPESWWFSVYWIGKKGQFPEPTDLVKTVGKAIAFTESGMEVQSGNSRGKKVRKDSSSYLKDNPDLADKEFRL